MIGALTSLALINEPQTIVYRCFPESVVSASSWGVGGEEGRMGGASDRGDK